MESKKKCSVPAQKPIRSPLKAIRAHCLGCVGGTAADVRKCTGPLLIGEQGVCPLHPYRFGKGRKSSVKSRLSPIKAIAKNCLWCSGGSAKERELCPSTQCGLYAFRKGKNPFLSESRREAAMRNLQKLQKVRCTGG